MLNFCFTIAFAVELLTNLYAFWLRDFLHNSWSCFDAIVVALSLVTLGPLDFPISVLRALRVLRLFGRFHSLKRILAALSASIIPVLNAFLIMLIVAMICDRPRALPFSLAFVEQQGSVHLRCSGIFAAQTPSWGYPSSANQRQQTSGRSTVRCSLSSA
jgi:hypothetical protein